MDVMTPRDWGLAETLCLRVVIRWHLESSALKDAKAIDALQKRGLSVSEVELAAG